MHGLINRAVQCFLRDTYGAALWSRVVAEGPLPVDGFEPMLTYDPALTELVLSTAARLLDRPREAMLEDLGHYLIFHPDRAPLRRLLRFGGAGFADFLASLDDLPDRARLALPDLDLPGLELSVAPDGDGPMADGQHLACRFKVAGAGHVMLGLLRAMADDYGALVLLDHLGLRDGAEILSIRLLDSAHAEGRHFDLAAPVAAA